MENEFVYIQCSSLNERRKLQDLLIKIRNGHFKVVRALSYGDYSVKVECEVKDDAKSTN